MLLDKAKQGVQVQLMLSNDVIKKSGKIYFSELNQGKSHVYFIGDGNKDLIHNKFCVIDNKTVINGAYN